MTRSDLVRSLIRDNPVLDASHVEASVCAFFETITMQLAANGRVEFRGFGSFFTRSRRAISGRNPHTGASVAVPARRIPRFRGSAAPRRF
ncbi:MAG: integration host factor subunit beta [Verrucomicrobiaceae bacterium]|nr:MAG: integration host factor subunit beta [Verrucomicrobiaceae bacterium]